MDSFIKNNLADIKKVLLHYNVQQAYLFGSAATNNFNAESDVDILFSFDEKIDYETYGKNYFSMIHDLEKLLNRQVDLVAEKTLKNPYLIAKVNQQKIQLL